MVIYVGNLSSTITDESLREVFLPFGEVNRVMILGEIHQGEPNTGRYGYVEMAVKSEGISAMLSLNGTMIAGRIVGTIEALPVSNKNWKNQPIFYPAGLGGQENGK